MVVSTRFPLGTYVGNPDGSSVSAEQAFEGRYDAFVKDMGGARPKYIDAFTDWGRGAAGLPGSAGFTAWSFAKTGNLYVGPGSGTIPVVGIPMSDASGQWSTVDTYYKQIISGSLDADYKGIVDAWAQNGYKTIEFRLGYEFTGGFMPWSPDASSNPAAARPDFVKAFQHLADLIHSQATADGATAKIVWNPALRNGSSYDVQTLYPGDQYVDVISTDIYSGGTPNN